MSDQDEHPASTRRPAAARPSADRHPGIPPTYRVTARIETPEGIIENTEGLPARLVEGARVTPEFVLRSSLDRCVDSVMLAYSNDYPNV